MKTKIFTVLAFLLAFSTFSVEAQKVVTKGRFTNSVYAFEPLLLRGVEAEDKETNVFLYQFLRFEAKIKEYNNLSLNYDTRALTNLQHDIDSEFRFRVNRLSLSAEDLFSGFLDVEAGRFFYHPGVTFGSLDGLDLVLKPTGSLRVQLYGGVESHLYRSYKVYEFDDATVYGGSVKYFNFYSTDIQLSYFEKKRNKNIQWQIAGIHLSNYSLDAWKFLLQTHYDIANSRLQRFFFSTRFTPSKDMHFYLNLKQQHPEIYADSYYNNEEIFGRFKNYNRAGIGGTYYLTDEYWMSVDYNFFKIEEGQGHKIIASVSNMNGNLGVVYETGDLGDQVGFIASYGYEFIPGLVGSLAFDYQRYRFSDIYSFEDQFANSLRVNYRISEQWRIDVVYQLLHNKFRETDHRFLNHIHFIW
jgi:hypothetical protein